MLSFESRFVLLLAIVPTLALIRPSQETTLAALGISKKGVTKSIRDIFPGTLLVLLLIAVLDTVVDDRTRIDNSDLSVMFYAFYALISCPAQEFVYRGYLFRLMALLQLSKWSRILLGALLYSAIHLFYLNGWTLLFTLVAGIFWNIYYDKSKNLAGVVVSHIVLGTAMIRFGFV